MYKEIGDDIESNKINENNKDNKDSEINVNNKDNIDNEDYKYGNKDNIKNEGFEDKRDYSENCIKESVFIMDNEIENDIRKSRQHNIKANKIITKKKGSCCPFVPFFN